MYEVLAAAIPLSQGDVIEDCPIPTLDVAPASTDLKPEFTIARVRIVVLTQACDLAQAKTTRILVAVAHQAADLVAQGVLKAAFIRDQIRRGQVYGWYFLPAPSAANTLPETVVDLHELHTVARPILERLIAEGKRVCRIQKPYREHLAQHFAVTYMRIGLPEPYETQP